MATVTAISDEGRVRSMIAWYDRIGNTIQMNVNGEWINGKIVEGYRTHDGCVNMETDTGRKIGCGASMEGVSFKKCNDSLGDLQTNADHIRSMSDEELADFLADSEKFSPCNNCDFHFVDAMNDDCKAPDGWICTKGYAAALIQKWLQSEVEE